MPTLLYAALWVAAWAVVVGGSTFTHRRYQRAMQEEVQSFNRQWASLERKYAGP